MKKLFLILIGLVCIHTVKAQNIETLPQTGVKVAFLGSIIYPGFKIGIERPSKIFQFEKNRKTISKERYWTYNVGFYRHKTYNTNLFLLSERQMRRQYSNGFFMEFAPGLGYSRTFMEGATFNVDDNGRVDKKSAAGYNYAMLSVSSGLGYDFSKKRDKPIKIYLKTSALIMAPYNSFAYVRPTIEVGTIYVPKSFWKANPVFKSKKK